MAGYMRLAHITHVRIFWQFVGHLDQVIQKQLDKSKVEQYRDRDLLHWTRWRFVQVLDNGARRQRRTVEAA